MSNKSVRIRTTVGGTDKYLTTKLENDVDFFEILSLKISQKDIYGTFNSDYGVIVGRVVANGGIGIPNAKISVFIPLSDEDAANSEITAIYPYTSPRDKNLDGVKYNLLPRVAVNNPFLIVGSYAPAVPVGTFATKEEFTTNPTYLEVYQKYYKFTTVTNQSGDYMIFGAPIGIQTVHMSVDITDIGQYSMTPATMVSQLGYAEQLFNGNKIKFSTDLDNIPSIDLQNVSVDVRPFWGDSDNFEIGITRQDFKIKATLVTSVTVFGAGFTDNYDAVWGYDNFFGDRDDSMSAMSINRTLEANGSTRNQGVKFNNGIASKRIGKYSIDVYTINPNITESEISPVSTSVDTTVNLNIFTAANINTQSDIQLLAKTQYGEIIDDGVFILTLPCNRNKMVVDEFGVLVPTTEDDPAGIFTDFYGMFIINYAPELDFYNNPPGRSRTDRDRSDRGRLKIPQYAVSNYYAGVTDLKTFTSERAGTVAGKNQADRLALNEAWRKQFFKFTGGKIYTISKYHGLMKEYEGVSNEPIRFDDITQSIWWNAGNVGDVVTQADVDAFPEFYPSADVDEGFAYNGIADWGKGGSGGGEILPNRPVFGAEWLNFCIYFPQIANYTAGTYDVTRLLSTDYGSGTDMTITNPYRVVGFRTDLSYFLRSDMHKATFVEVPQSDLVKIVQSIPDQKGFTSGDVVFSGPNALEGDYPKKTSGSSYFYRGIKTSDIIRFLLENGIISA
jgi:hypothetical protein